MDSQKFPKELGGDLANRTFLDILLKSPDIVEFVDSLWVEEKRQVFLRIFMSILNSCCRIHLLKASTKIGQEHMSKTFQMKSYHLT